MERVTRFPAVSPYSSLCSRALLRRDRVVAPENTIRPDPDADPGRFLRDPLRLSAGLDLVFDLGAFLFVPGRRSLTIGALLLVLWPVLRALVCEVLRSVRDRL